MQLQGCNTSSKLSTDLIQASTLYCQGDNTNLWNVYYSREGVKQLLLDSLQAKQGIVGVLHFHLLSWRGALQVMRGKRARTEECVLNCILFAGRAHCIRDKVYLWAKALSFLLGLIKTE